MMVGQSGWRTITNGTGTAAPPLTPSLTFGATVIFTIGVVTHATLIGTCASYTGSTPSRPSRKFLAVAIKARVLHARALLC